MPSFPFKLPRMGDYPLQYNEKVHGPYDPARFYGKPDTPFGQVKVSEIGQWIMRRNKSPRAVVGLCSRAYWRWQHKYMLPKYTGISVYAQYAVTMCIFFYILNIGKIREHKTTKYHW